MASTSMFEAFESMTGVDVGVTYMSLAFITMGLLGYLMLVTIKDGWTRHQSRELELGDLFWVFMRSMILFMFMLAVLSPAS